MQTTKERTSSTSLTQRQQSSNLLSVIIIADKKLKTGFVRQMVEDF